MEELMAFRPYLFFGGNCREAFTRYQEIFGGELTLMAMKDVPGEEPPADKAELIIHAALLSVRNC
jgi:PhnB protein